MRLRPRTVRARLTLWYTLVLSIPLVGFAIISYLLFSRTLQSRTDAFIRDALTVFAREVVSERRAVPTFAEAMRRTIQEVRFRDLDIAVLEQTGALLAVSAPLGMQPIRNAFPGDSAAVLQPLRSGASNDDRSLTVTGENGSYRIMRQPFAADGQTFTLAAVYPLIEVATTLRRIRRIFFIAIPLLIISAASGGYFLARRSFEPVSAMAARAAEIGASTLHERLPIVAEDELGALARVLNELLDRLEQSFLQMRRFMADASHELRTPTAILRTEADVTLSRAARSEAEYRDSMLVVQDAARRISRIVDDIFLLARADAGHLSPRHEAIYLEDIVHDAIRAVRPIAEQRAVNIELLEMLEAPFTGDADLLGRVLLNLLDNAIKHAPATTTIHVAMQRHDAHWQIAVVDHGPGIPEAAQGRVFERFFRADTARARTEATTTSGAGLGLAIGRRIAEMHGGRLDLVSSRPGRTEFRLELPVLRTA